MITIIPSQWGLSLREFKEWAAKSNAEIHRKIYNDPFPVDRAEEFYFTNDEDLVAFKLSFSESTDLSVGVYYAPYIPKI